MRITEEPGTRDRILEVAEVSLGNHGYHGTRLHEIAQCVGIQKASLFHYFPSKAALYQAVVEQGFGETESVLKRVLSAKGSPIQKVRSLVEAYIDTVAAHPERTKILLRQSLGDVPPGYLPPDPQRLLNLVTTYVAEAQRAKVFAPMDPAGLVLAVVGMVAFFFTSVPVVAPAWLGDPGSAAAVRQVKRHVMEIVDRCLRRGSEDNQPEPKPAYTSVPQY